MVLQVTFMGKIQIVLYTLMASLFVAHPLLIPTSFEKLIDSKIQNFIWYKNGQKITWSVVFIAMLSFYWLPSIS